MPHELFEAGQLGAEGLFGFLADLELGAVKALALAGGKTFVVGFLADAFEFFEGQWLDFFQRHFFDFVLNRFGLGLGFRLRLGVETGQCPAIEAIDVVGANQLTEVLVG
ncbi:hypothetical protein D3C80_1927060 [compost metagenome]